jgi:outer membrane translocation and assembly module TamA
MSRGSLRTFFAIALCPGITLTAPVEPPLRDVELRLVCGDKDPEAPRSWRDVPVTQARFHLRAFLNARGHYEPKFDAPPAGGLTVDPGPRTHVASVEAPQAPAEVDLPRLRGVVGETLTPALLDRVERWVSGRLQTLGYPCPEVGATAEARTGKIVVNVKAGAREDLVSVQEEDIPGVGPGILRRYDVFRLGAPYNREKIELTERRILDSELLQSVHYSLARCRGGAVLRQEAVAGPPRLLSFGFGSNTEGLLLGRASWKHARLGHSASQLRVSLLGSAKEQRLSASANWYPLPFPSRRSFAPLLDVRHRNEEFFEALESRLLAGIATTWDGESAGLTLRAGPAWNALMTLRGLGPRAAHLGTLELEAQAMSHAFEYFRPRPRAGWQASLTAAFADERILSAISAQRVELAGQGLWNVRQLDPPLWILGARGVLATTITPEPVGSSRIPASMRHFLGGSRDLRGFGRQELPGDEAGALALAYLGVEARWGGLSESFQPFAFLDTGALGREALEWSLPVYAAPGAGIRWASPIGVFRATLARGGTLAGEAQARLRHLQFYLSYGEEF